ncbi:hypothetical protein B0G57_10379 [Trinickia symbiotica]|uniref:HutD family protein n=1 Tax=Trinickia symbiotica TaxID=863227 RepID=A0A2N7X4E6_9BURK|nr:HutD family protein [Trinickia symbiotica]PMS36633.1 hypothetical protein C0Z20_11005 [Trinickia symbiotica]PPK46055.1 hypothetical protein B0G57_10379 [Trinickia symbiotica]
MSAIEIRPLSAVPAEPWRNGGGITRTLAAKDGEWRISLAEVERDGPYSRFDGITRVSFVVRGSGVTLRHEASAVALKPFEAAEYDGGTAWNAALMNGPVTVLNVMSSSGRYRAKVLAIREATIVPPGCAAVVVALDSACSYSEQPTSAAGTCEPGQAMVVYLVDRPLWLAPAVCASVPAHEIRPPVLVVIERAVIR